MRTTTFCARCGSAISCMAAGDFEEGVGREDWLARIVGNGRFANGAPGDGALKVGAAADVLVLDLDRARPRRRHARRAGRSAVRARPRRPCRRALCRRQTGGSRGAAGRSRSRRDARSLAPTIPRARPRPRRVRARRLPRSSRWRRRFTATGFRVADSDCRRPFVCMTGKLAFSLSLVYGPALKFPLVCRFRGARHGARHGRRLHRQGRQSL